jgi:hypothetical protein
MIKTNSPNSPNTPNIPGMSDMPGMGAMTDTLEFVKNLWGGMGLPGMNMSSMNMPGMVIPTLSVEEIRKKVSDLKAVETWLDLNRNMLRSTIQALEVQAATIATLQSMGNALSATVNSATGLGQGVQQSTAASAASFEPRPEKKSSGAPEPSSRDEADAASLTAPLVNAAAWWNLLQNQFSQAVTSAMTADTQAPADGAGAPATSKSSSDTGASPAPARKRGRRMDD